MVDVGTLGKPVLTRFITSKTSFNELYHNWAESRWILVLSVCGGEWSTAITQWMGFISVSGVADQHQFVKTDRSLTEQ